MKKLIILAAAAVLLALGIVSVALAAHGGWDPGENGGGECASCHRVHTAAGPGLIKETSAYLLCYSCHGGANFSYGNPWTGVKNGVPLNGGTIDPVNGSTSQHTVKGLFLQPNPLFGNNDSSYTGINEISDGVGYAFGGITDTSAPGLLGTLECISCHNPHGSTNYRYLRDSKNSTASQDFYTYLTPYRAFGVYAGGFNPEANPDKFSLAFQDHQVSPTHVEWKDDPAAPYSPGWGAGVTDPDGNPMTPAGSRPAPSKNVVARIGNATPGYANYTKGMRDFCASCHKSYLTKPGSGKVLSTGNFGNQDAFDSTKHSEDYYLNPGTQVTADKIREMNPATGVVTVQATEYEGAVYRHPTSVSLAGEAGITDDAGAKTFYYRLRFAAPDENEDKRTEFVCTTCHFAHGTTYKLTGRTSQAEASTSYVGPAKDTALLMFNGRQICMTCHQRDKMADKLSH